MLMAMMIHLSSWRIPTLQSNRWGNSTTTPKDLLCDEDVKIVLYILAESVAARLRENGFRCRVVEISVGG